MKYIENGCGIKGQKHSRVVCYFLNNNNLFPVTAAKHAGPQALNWICIQYGWAIRLSNIKIMINLAVTMPPLVTVINLDCKQLICKNVNIKISLNYLKL